MNDTLEKAVAFVMENEGGFVIDSGGPTNFGITAKYLMEHGRWIYDRNENGVIDEDDMHKFTRDDAITEYKGMFTSEHYQLLNDPELAIRVFDMAVNAGPFEANLLLQRVYNTFSGRRSLIEDGKLGFSTLSFINHIKDPAGLVTQYKTQRANYYRYLADQNTEKYEKYLNNWLERANK